MSKVVSKSPYLNSGMKDVKKKHTRLKYPQINFPALKTLSRDSSFGFGEEKNEIKSDFPVKTRAVRKIKLMGKNP